MNYYLSPLRHSEYILHPLALGRTGVSRKPMVPTEIEGWAAACARNTDAKAGDQPSMRLLAQRTRGDAQTEQYEILGLIVDATARIYG